MENQKKRPACLDQVANTPVTRPSRSLPVFEAPVIQPLFPPESLFTQLPDAGASSADSPRVIRLQKDGRSGTSPDDGDQASLYRVESHEKQSILSQREENQRMKAWVLGVAAAVWHVRGSRISESYERELMRLHDNHSGLRDEHGKRPKDQEELTHHAALHFTASAGQNHQTTFFDSEDGGQERAELDELREQLAALERRRATQVEKLRERYMNIQQQRVRCIQRLRNALLSGNHSMRLLLQRLLVAGSDSVEVVRQLQTLLQEQERRLTMAYVQQVSRLQAVLTKALRKEGKLSKRVPGDRVEQRDDAQSTTKDESRSSGRLGFSGACQKLTKVPQPLYKNCNSSLKRRSSYWLRLETPRSGKKPRCVADLSQSTSSHDDVCGSSDGVSDKQRRQGVPEVVRVPGLQSDGRERDPEGVPQIDARNQGTRLDNQLVMGKPGRHQRSIGPLHSQQDITGAKRLAVSRSPGDCLSSEEGQNGLSACPARNPGRDQKKALDREASTPRSLVASNTTNYHGSSPGSDANSAMSSLACQPCSGTTLHTRSDRVRRSRKRSFAEKEASPPRSGAKGEIASERRTSSTKQETKNGKEGAPRVCVEELTAAISAVSFVQLKKITQAMKRVHPGAFGGVSKASLTKKETLVRHVVRFVASQVTTSRMPGWVSAILASRNTEELVNSLIAPPA